LVIAHGFPGRWCRSVINCVSKVSLPVPVEVRVKRNLKRGLYVTSPRSQRHLTKPLRRYGLEKRRGTAVKLADKWHFP
ncbi:hypothetical protein CW707_02360, partial [Candidatus Bathyarchaeota archaeon]